MTKLLKIVAFTIFICSSFPASAEDRPHPLEEGVNPESPSGGDTPFLYDKLHLEESLSLPVLHDKLRLQESLIKQSILLKAEGWKHPLENWAKLESPLVEVTPFVFKEKLYLMESWQKQWEHPEDKEGSRFTGDEIRIRDIAADRIVSTPLTGHGLGMTFVWQNTVYVFAGNWGTKEKWNFRDIVMTSSTDLKDWTKPRKVLHSEDNEKFFNVSVCRGKDQFIMLVESNDPKWPAFTFKYFTSPDLINWTQIPYALYGTKKYVGGPALYYEGGIYYTLYLQSLGGGHYETRITRSQDLIHWQDAPDGRPFVTYQLQNKIHPLRPAHLREKNASDAEICYWQAKTIVYYTGGDQHYAGDLQYADYPGTPQELLEHFFKD